METIIATIKGEIVKIYEDTYIDKNDKKQIINKAIILSWIDDEPFKMNIALPKGEFSVGDTVDNLYKIFTTKNGYMIVSPIN